MWILREICAQKAQILGEFGRAWQVFFEIGRGWEGLGGFKTPKVSIVTRFAVPYPNRFDTGVTDGRPHTYLVPVEMRAHQCRTFPRNVDTTGQL